MAELAAGERGSRAESAGLSANEPEENAAGALLPAAEEDTGDAVGVLLPAAEECAEERAKTGTKKETEAGLWQN